MSDEPIKVIIKVSQVKSLYFILLTVHVILSNAKDPAEGLEKQPEYLARCFTTFSMTGTFTCES